MKAIVIASALCFASAAALKTPPPSGAPTRNIGRRGALAAALGGMVPVLTASPAFAAFSTTLSEERRAVMDANRGFQLGGDDAVYRMTCASDDVECLKARRAKAQAGIKNVVSGNFGTAEDRTAAIKRQASSCRITCGADGLRETCKQGDEECLKKKREASAFKQEDGVKFVGVVAAAAAIRVATRPEASEKPKGMEDYNRYKEQRANRDPNAPDVRLSLAQAISKKREEAKAAKEAEE